MSDELIRLDTTIIGIDSLINKVSTVEEAKALYAAKAVIYSQQRYAADVQPIKRGHWEEINEYGGFGVRYRKRQEATAWEKSSILKCASKGRTDEFTAEIIGNIYDNPELIGGEADEQPRH